MGNASSLSPERIALVQGALGYLAFGECVVALRIFPDGAFLAPAKPFWQYEAMEMGGTGAIEILADDGKSTKVAHAHTVRGQVIVGAEAENRELEALLDQRRALLGES